MLAFWDATGWAAHRQRSDLEWGLLHRVRGCNASETIGAQRLRRFVAGLEGIQPVPAPSTDSQQREVAFDPDSLNVVRDSVLSRLELFDVERDAGERAVAGRERDVLDQFLD